MQQLSEKHYLDDDVVLSCYCLPDYSPRADSNIQRETKEFYIDQIKSTDGAANAKDDSLEEEEEKSSPTKRSK